VGRGLKIIGILFWIVAIVILIIQIINPIANGVNRESLVIVSELIIFAIFGLVYIFRNKLKIKSDKKLFWKFVIIGYVATILAETAYIFSKPLHRNLGIDLLLVAPWYILWMILWFFVFKKYDFSIKEAFYLGGFHGFVVEGLIAGGLILNPLIGIVMLPILTIVYGWFFVIPYILTKEQFKHQKKISLKKKILISLIPLLAYIPGFIWIAILKNALNLTLH
jgi:hypothetical protein